jgi:segregation and condensation protein A
VTEPADPAIDAPQLQLDGFAGPLDLLLELARRQKVDLARISISELVDQYLAAVSGPGRADLIRAADWLVMAAWLTWLKSRLLLPGDPDEAQQGEQAQQVLTQRLMELERVRATADWLNARPQLGWDMFERGFYERPDAAAPAATYLMLVEACLGLFRLTEMRPAGVYQPRRILQWTPGQAIFRMDAILREHPKGGDLLDFVPTMPAGLANRQESLRGAIASTLVAGLELSREGMVRLHQDAAFAPIRVEAAQALRSMPSRLESSG